MRLKKGGDGEGNDNPLLYPCLGNPMDKGAWWATVYGVARVEHDLATKTAIQYIVLIYVECLPISTYKVNDRRKCFVCSAPSYTYDV